MTNTNKSKTLEVKTPTVDTVEINTAYMTVLALELILRDVERRLNMQKATLQGEKKLNFSRFCDLCKKALHFAERLTQDIYDMDAGRKWKYIPVWQEESNELARLILLFADKSADVENVYKVFKTLRSLPGEGIITDEVLDTFYLKKI